MKAPMSTLVVNASPLIHLAEAGFLDIPEAIVAWDLGPAQSSVLALASGGLSGWPLSTTWQGGAARRR